MVRGRRSIGIESVRRVVAPRGWRSSLARMLQNLPSPDGKHPAVMVDALNGASNLINEEPRAHSGLAAFPEAASVFLLEHHCDSAKRKELIFIVVNIIPASSEMS